MIGQTGQASGHDTTTGHRRGAVNRIGIVLLLALSVGACGRGEPAASQAAEQPPATASAPAPTASTAAPTAAAVVEADPLAAMAQLSGVDCTRSEAGLQSCRLEGYDISGADRACAEDDTGFGAVLNAEGVALLDRFPGEGATTVARLSKGHFLCVQFVADATGGGEGWAYVTAIPTALVARCAAGATCGSTAFAPAWTAEAPAGDCRIGPEGRYTTACPSGWVPRADIDEYSMGLGGG